MSQSDGSSPTVITPAQITVLRNVDRGALPFVGVPLSQLEHRPGVSVLASISSHGLGFVVTAPAKAGEPGKLRLTPAGEAALAFADEQMPVRRSA